MNLNAYKELAKEILGLRPHPHSDTWRGKPKARWGGGYEVQVDGKTYVLRYDKVRRVYIDKFGNQYKHPGKDRIAELTIRRQVGQSH